MAFDPEISEWDNPAVRRTVTPYMLKEGEPGELKHLSTPRKRK